MEKVASTVVKLPCQPCAISTDCCLKLCFEKVSGGRESRNSGRKRNCNCLSCKPGRRLDSGESTTRKTCPAKLLKQIRKHKEESPSFLNNNNPKFFIGCSLQDNLCVGLGQKLRESLPFPYLPDSLSLWEYLVLM